MRVPAALAALFFAAALPALAAEIAPTLTVTGEGSAAVAPDMATVQIGVTSEADTAKAALDANTAAMQAALDRLKAAGIEDRDIQTTGLNLGPRYDYNRTKADGSAEITGFLASNGVTVRVRDLGGLGALLDAVVTDGANTLNGVSFGLQDPVPALDAARKDAVADARRKAELYAAAAGVGLGRIVSIAEQSGYQPPMPMAMAEASYAKSAPVPVAAGEVKMMASVTIVWGLAE
ncbi:MAG: SIMPL domain-containing protein [Paracoccaceae bacterium]